MRFGEFRGHFMTREEVATLMHCDAADLPRRDDLLSFGGRIVGEEVYPACQFDPGGLPTPGMDEVLARLEDFDPAEVVAFCSVPLPSLGGFTPIDWLRRGGEPGSIEATARALAAATADRVA